MLKYIVKMTKSCFFSQDSPISQRWSVMQKWLKANGFIGKNKRPQDLQILTLLLDYDELKVALQTLWKELLQKGVNKAVAT